MEEEEGGRRGERRWSKRECSGVVGGVDLCVTSEPRAAISIEKTSDAFLVRNTLERPGRESVGDVYVERL